ncbi:hypothetical protein HELRODRAFT_175231 [Helobdella robusta]|uniref:Uncharacterized protein n=1 Tax=Helobdella robusta TaxID=6412 RepID=T1F917_HELRO|nr:hypothetical protein HELRODRAFT_175231 [Helobdella robusta]ESO00754.1 hypothetical protein HELRODRAFT_175231 [Helobdella robusta]
MITGDGNKIRVDAASNTGAGNKIWSSAGANTTCWRKNPGRCWRDDYEPTPELFSHPTPFCCCGPSTSRHRCRHSASILPENFAIWALSTTREVALRKEIRNADVAGLSIELEGTTGFTEVAILVVVAMFVFLVVAAIFVFLVVAAKDVTLVIS